jgi:hypothetical protein
MPAHPEISGASFSPKLLSSDKKGPGLKSDFTLGGKMLSELEISEESSSKEGRF